MNSPVKSAALNLAQLAIKILSDEGEHPNDDHGANAVLVGLLQVRYNSLV